MLKIVLIGLALILIAGGGYLIGLQPQQQSAITRTQQVSTPPSTQSSKLAQSGEHEAELVQKSNQSLKENIKASFESKNFAALKGYMADEVVIIKEGTGCCGNKTPSEAVDFMSGTGSLGGSWDFELKDKKYKNLVENVELQGHILAVSSSDALLNIIVNKEGKISDIYYYTSYKILVP